MHFCKVPVFIVAKVHTFILQHLCFSGASLVAQTIKNLPAVQEAQVQSLGWKDPKEKGMATYSAFLPGKSHGKEGNLGDYSSWGRKESDMVDD